MALGWEEEGDELLCKKRSDSEGLVELRSELAVDNTALGPVLGEFVVERVLMRADLISVLEGLLEPLGATRTCKSSKLTPSVRVKGDSLILWLSETGTLELFASGLSSAVLVLTLS